jgi:hypothetical protein
LCQGLKGDIHRTIRALFNTTGIPVAEIATCFGAARSALYRAVLKLAA